MGLTQHREPRSDWTDQVASRLDRSTPTTMKIANVGYLHIDRHLPFLVVYRNPGSTSDTGTQSLITAEAACLTISGVGVPISEIRCVIQGLVARASKIYPAFCLVEVWASPALPDPEETTDGSIHHPYFCLHVAKATQATMKTAMAFVKHLEIIKILKKKSEVELQVGRAWGMPKKPPLLTAKQAASMNCVRLGIEVAPIYRDTADGHAYPGVLRLLRRQFSRALRRGFFAFFRDQTSDAPLQYGALGRRAVVKTVWDIDERLSQIGSMFDYLLDTTPVNASTAWSRFRKSGFTEDPSFEYRPSTVDPFDLKRKLFNIPVDRVDDPTLEILFRGQQLEIDRFLTLLLDRNTPRFVYGSVQIFGTVDDSLLSAASEILQLWPQKSRSGRGHALNAEEFAQRARAEIEAYSAGHPAFDFPVMVREDIYSGLMVSRGRLLIGRNTRIPASRVKALLNHEIGTHLVTYFNGRDQRFKQLSIGLAGYDELQEGLAVLAEYLVGGLNPARLRLLAARVIAAHGRLKGDSFCNTFNQLRRSYCFDQKTAFTITMRIFRSGGLTKDAIYLRGLIRVLHYIRQGGDIELLYLGKFAFQHIPLIKELQHRRVLRPMPIRPLFLDDPQVLERLEKLRHGFTWKLLTSSAKMNKQR